MKSLTEEQLRYIHDIPLGWDFVRGGVAVVVFGSVKDAQRAARQIGWSSAAKSGAYLPAPEASQWIIVKFVSVLQVQRGILDGVKPICIYFLSGPRMAHSNLQTLSAGLMPDPYLARKVPHYEFKPPRRRGK